MSRWNATDIPDLSGRTFVVTGANSGLGWETTKELAAHGARVVMAVRDLDKGRAALTRLPVGATPPELRRLDLSDLDSVREFAATVGEVDVLVNNAGIMMPPRSLTKQGHELQFGTNHLGHFALTGLLLDRIGAGRDPRVVTVSSGLHRRGKIAFDDLNGDRSYSPTGHYAQSKYANVLFGLELDRRLRAAGSPVKSLLAHPGYAATNLQTTGPAGLLNLGGRIGNVLLAQSAAMGALPQLYAATSPEAESGAFYGPDRLMEQRGHPKRVHPVRSATDPSLAARLWTVSEDLTGIAYTF